MTLSKELEIAYMIFVLQYILRTITLKTDILSHNTGQDY